jgi:hypothetical protein
VAPNENVQFDCRVVPDASSQGSYKKQVRVGAAEVPTAGCPQIFQGAVPKSPGGKFDIFMHALDIDVVP